MRPTIQRTGSKNGLVISQPAPPAIDMTEAAAAGGVRDVTAGWVNPLMRVNQDPVLASRGGDLIVYEELLRDHTVYIAFQQRKLALLGHPLEVSPGGKDPLSQKAAEDLQAQLQAVSWDTITGAMLVGRINGYAVGECMWGLDGNRAVLRDIKVRKARRFVFGPEGDLRLRTIGRPYGEPLAEAKFWTFTCHEDVTDNPYGFGLGQILYWLVWFKRNDVKLWFQALDKHASPTAIGEFVPGAPQGERDKLLAALASIRNSSAIAVPQGFAVRLLEAAKSGAGDYSQAYEMLDDAITMVIAGQTMTSRQGSSEAQANVHQDTLAAIVQADNDLISDSFNAGPARWITAWNFPGALSPRIRRRTEPPEDLVQQSTIDQAVINMGYEPSLAYIQEKYGPHWTKAKPASGFSFVRDPDAEGGDAGAADGED